MTDQVDKIVLASQVPYLSHQKGSYPRAHWTAELEHKPCHDSHTFSTVPQPLLMKAAVSVICKLTFPEGRRLLHDEAAIKHAQLYWDSKRTEGSAPAKARVCSGPSGPAFMCLLQRVPCPCAHCTLSPPASANAPASAPVLSPRSSAPQRCPLHCSLLSSRSGRQPGTRCPGPV